MNQHAAVSYVAANEPGTSAAPATKGWQAIAEADARRKAWLDSHAATWREEVAEHHKAMGITPKARGWRAKRAIPRRPRFK